LLLDLTRFHNLRCRSRGDKRIALSAGQDVFERARSLASGQWSVAVVSGRSGIDLKTSDSIYLTPSNCDEVRPADWRDTSNEIHQKRTNDDVRPRWQHQLVPSS